MEKIKVLHLIASPNIGGAERLLLSLIDNVDSSNYEIHVGIYYDVRVATNEFFEMISDHCPNLHRVNINKAYDPRQIPQVVSLVKRLKPDIIHSHGYKTNIFAFFLSRIFSIPVISTVHGWLHINRLTTKALYLLNVVLLKKFNKIIAVSSEINKKLLELNFKKDRIAFIPNIPSVNNSSPDAMIQTSTLFPQFDMTVGFVGRLEPVKGGEPFIKAASIVLHEKPGVGFILLGDGPQRTELENFVKEQGLEEKILFLGFQREPAQFFKSMNLYTLPSLDEGIPLTLLEAMSMEIPVVATAVGGVPDVIDHEIHGLLIRPNDEKDLAQAITYALDNADAMKAMVQKARERIEKDYSAKAWISAIQNEYTALCKR